MPGLNDQQRKAVDYDAGPLIVLAGPGAGKTRVIVHRVQRLIASGVEPANILAVTFTVKAAGQLRQRLAQLVGPAKADRVQARTFHGFAQHLLTRFGDLVGLPPRHVIIDSAQELRVLRNCARELGVLAPYAGEGLAHLLAQCRQCADRLQNAGLFPERVEEFCAEWRARLDRNDSGLDAAALRAERARQARFHAAARLHAAASDERRRRGQFTYEDLIFLAIRLLLENDLARTLCRDEFRHVVVDEFQDVNAGQIELLRALCPPDADLCVVGDDDQSIYLFRGADDRAFTKFGAHWPAAETIPLTENYRSEACILDAAAATIARAEDRFAPDKIVERAAELRPLLPAPGAAVECVECDDDSRQFGEVIAAMIKTDRAANPARPWSAYAAIATTHLDLARVEQALRAEGIPCIPSQAPSALDDPGVRDVLAWMGVLADPGSTRDAHRLLVRPPVGVPASRVAGWLASFHAQRSRHRLDSDSYADPGDFTAWLAQHQAGDPGTVRFLAMLDAMRTASLQHPAHRALLEVIRVCDAPHADLCPARERAVRVSAFTDLLRLARDRAPLLPAPGDLRAFHEYWNELSEEDQRAAQRDEDLLGPAPADDDSPDAVSLLTAHKAKGLEFDTVFVVRVSLKNGFGSVKREDDELPDGLEDRGGDTRDAGSRRRAEARRLFYVACTRAERRLVLLAKKKKSRTDGDFFQELTGDPRGLVTCRNAADVFDQGARAGVKLASRGWLVDSGPPGGWEAELASERAAARAAAADALESVGAEAVPADLDRAAAALRSAAARLGVVASMEKFGRAPEWAAGNPAAAALAESLACGLARAREPAPPTRPMPAPLRLSYSTIDQYHRCPRCFYLKHIVKVPEPASGAQAIGVTAHRALQAHFTALRRHESGGAPPPDLSASARRLYLSTLPPGTPADPDTLSQLQAMVAAAASLHQPSDEVMEIEFTIEFPYLHRGAEHTFTTKMDRLDLRREGGGGHRIIDYKTGREREGITHPGPRDLQLGVYALALRHHQGIDLADRDTPARGVAEYWHLPTAARGRIDLAEIDYAHVRDRIDEAIAGMLAGRFEPKKGCEGLCTYITL